MSTTAEGIRTTVDWLERAKNLSPLINEQADEAEELGSITPRLTAAFEESGLARIAVAKELGGADVSLVEYIEILEELSRADMSAGWTFMVNTSIAQMVSHHIKDEGAAIMWADSNEAVIPAGQVQANGTAVRDGEGWRVSGSFRFASGSSNANWMIGGAIVQDKNGNPVLGPDGEPEKIWFHVPKSKVVLKGNWNVLGLKATASQDYEVPEQYIPDGLVLPHDAANPWGQQQYPARTGGFALGGPITPVYGCHPPVVLGGAKRALEEVAKLAQAKTRLYSNDTIATQGAFLREFVTADSKLRAARAALINAAAEIDELCATRDDLVSKSVNNRLAAASIHAHMTSLEVVQFAYKWSGATAVREGNTMGRIMRDMHVAVQHLTHDHHWLEVFAETILPERSAELG